MNNGPDYSAASVSIGSVEFDKKGSIYFNGFVEGVEVEKLISADEKDFDKFLPKEHNDLEFLDQNDLYTAMLDDYYNLHWVAKFGENAIYRVIRLERIITEMLYELYIEQS